VLGRVTVHSPAEQEAVDAFLHMDQVALQAFNTRVDDEAALNSVLAGDHLTKIRSGIVWRKEQGLWTVGRETLNVLSVQIVSTTATIRACSFDGTSEVNKSGRNAVQPPGSKGTVSTLVRRDGVWRTTSSVMDTAKCDALKL
jgi:hypothetical protein